MYQYGQIIFFLVEKKPEWGMTVAENYIHNEKNTQCSSGVKDMK